MIRAVILAGLYLLALPLLAADTYNIDPTHTFPRFAVNHFGFSTHHGQFNKTAGKITLDRAAKTGSIEITVQTASIGTGDPRLEGELRGEKFFDVEKHPTMVFKSKSVKFNGDVPASAEGELMLLGVTRPVTLTIAQVRCGPHPFRKNENCGAEVSGALKRSDFGMKAFLPLVGDEITLNIQVEALKE